MLSTFRSGGASSPFSSSDSSRKFVLGAMPALAKTWSIRPNVLTASLNRFRRLSQELVSAFTNFRFSVLDKSDGGGLRSPMTTFAPSWRHNSTVARPMPEEPPILGYDILCSIHDIEVSEPVIRMTLSLSFTSASCGISRLSIVLSNIWLE